MFSIRAKIAARFGWGCTEFGARVEGNVCIGRGVYIASGVEIIAERNEKIVIGDHSFVHKGTLMYPYGGEILVGKNVGINPYCVIYGHGGVKIGNDVMIATACTIIPANHNFGNLDEPMSMQGVKGKGIVIGNNVWLGARCVVLDGVKIGDGAVIGAGAVVSRDIPPNSIAVGIPARVVRYRVQENVSDHG